jgi:hypothetical protein
VSLRFGWGVMPPTIFAVGEFGTIVTLLIVSLC